MDALVKLAFDIAKEAHAGQTDKSGEDYFGHCERVWKSLLHENREVQVVALLHDTVEDTNVSLDDINAAFGLEIEEAVDAITRKTDEKYSDYLIRVRKNPIACKVKIADLTDNLQKDRLDKLPIETRKRLFIKYTCAMYFLAQ